MGLLTFLLIFKKVMLEVIKHLFGMCGEPHFNIFHLILGSVPGIPYIKVLVKSKLSKK